MKWATAPGLPVPPFRSGFLDLEVSSSPNPTQNGGAEILIPIAAGLSAKAALPQAHWPREGRGAEYLSRDGARIWDGAEQEAVRAEP